MGSDLFRVRVLQRRGPSVSVRYTIVHPDVYAVEETKNVALQTLTDAYWKCREGYLWDVPTSVSAKAKALARAHPRKAVLERWLTLAHGEEVELTAEQYAALTTGGDRDEARPRYSSWGSSNGRYTASLPTDYARFVAAADEAIASVRLEDPQNHPRDEAGDDPAIQPAVTMVIAARDGATLHHLFVGLEWDSRVYDFEGYL